MKTYEVVRNGQGREFDYSQDHCFIKLASEKTDGAISFVEDTLKPNFFLGRHHHKKMTEVFYIDSATRKGQVLRDP